MRLEGCGLKEASMAKTSLPPTTNDVWPWALNHSLSEAEQRALEEVARQQPEQAQAVHTAWQQVRAATLSQPQRAPASAVRQRVLAQARAQTQLKPQPRWLPVLSGFLLAVLTLAVLWNVMQPGIGLQWSVNGSVPTAFRVYRAPVGSDRFEIVREVPALPGTLDYSFVDTALWPGQAYQYRIEAVNHEAMSATISASGSDVLPLQLAIVFSSLLIGLAVALVLRQLAIAPPPAWKMV
jgi:hypothetical protein